MGRAQTVSGLVDRLLGIGPLVANAVGVAFPRRIRGRGPQVPCEWGHPSRAVASRAVQLIGRRYEDIRVDESFAAWTPWFFEIAWDHTLVLTDYARAEVTVLCITDTD